MFSYLMKKNFDEHASTYESHAEIQKQLANELYEYIKNKKQDFKKIFEIGCGTGYLSEKLLKLKPKYLFLNDISDNMLKLAKNKFGKNKKVLFIEKDFEEYEFTESFDLIASNAVIQWIRNLDDPFKKIKKALNKNGIFAFSIFIKDTFYELTESFKAAYSQLNLPFENHVLDFLTGSSIYKQLMLSGFNIIFSEMKEYKLLYNHPLDFLKELRSIGAGHLNENNVRYGIMKRMINNYIAIFRDEKGLIPVTYKIFYAILS